ncbi:hypothetical protein [Microcoleus sp. D3_18a_C4]|uniref:hypothetical protein n=1 Tax=unclassified Microcoleus TaxID=2642155 RepID=UPI002FCE7988
MSLSNFNILLIIISIVYFALHSENICNISYEIPVAKDAGGKAGDRRVGGDFDRAKDMVQRAEQRFNTIYVKNLILKNQNW